MVTTSPEAPCISTFEAEYPVQKLHIPSLQDLLDFKNVPEYPYHKSWQDARHDPVFILHTSGSTGIPKPLLYTHSFITGIANNTTLSPPEGFRSLDKYFRQGRFLMTLPSFHIAGLGFSLISPAFHGGIPVYPLPTAPPTTESLMKAIQSTEIDWAFVPPVVIDDLGKDPALLDIAASRIKYVFYTGGSVPKASGDVVVKRIGIYQVLGSSECATFPLIRAEDDKTHQDWNYIQIHPDVNVEFHHRFDDLHELVVVKRKDPGHYQPVFGHFPDSTEYETRDLFSPHPIKPGLWTHRSRIDDVIVFLNGEKTNPISFEQEVTRHSEVRSALVGGQQRFEACLIIEPVNTSPLSEEEKAKLIERIWPVVDDANTRCPAHAKVSKSRILIGDPSIPFPRAGKGTIQRQAAMNLYAEQIDELYAEKGLNSSDELLKDLDLSDKTTVREAVGKMVKDVTSWNTFNDADEFFSLGMDSLQVLRLNRDIKSKLGLAALATRDIYANPSVDLLTAEVMRLALAKDITSVSDLETERIDAVNSTLRLYEVAVDKLAASSTNGFHSATSPDDSTVIILTGSTGALGSFVLNELLQTDVKHIYCFNRSHDSQALQATRNAQQGLSTEFPPSRISFLTVDLTKPSFGLDNSTLDVISSSVTNIIHNAWPVDFNKTLSSFRPSLDGVLNLVSFASQAKLSPSMLFISSISSVANYAASPFVPEIVIADPSCTANMGYGESKYLAERILDYASRKLRVNVGTVRVGQICGTAETPRGWSVNEWFPSLVLSSMHIGALPKSLGAQLDHGEVMPVDWIPIDKLAGVLVELGKTLETSASAVQDGLKVFHAVNPNTIRWNVLLPTVKETLSQVGQGREVNEVSYAEWVDLLSTSSASTISEDDLRTNPGVKLLDFYKSLQDMDKKGITRLEIKKTLATSKSFESVEAVKGEWVKGWIEGWFGRKSR